MLGSLATFAGSAGLATMAPIELLLSLEHEIPNVDEIAQRESVHRHFCLLFQANRVALSIKQRIDSRGQPANPPEVRVGRGKRTLDINFVVLQLMSLTLLCVRQSGDHVTR